MALKRFALYGAATLTALTLANCGGDESPNGKFSNTTDIRDALAGTDYECVRWDDYGDSGARCSLDKYFNTPNHWVNMSDDPEMLAAVKMDADPENMGGVAGDGWFFDCDTDLTSSQCSEVADILGGEHIERGHWS